MENKSDSKVLGDRKKALEEQFFARQEREMRERVRRQAAERDRREALAEASGVRDPAVLDRLVALGIEPEAVTALSLVPLVQVAWADRTLHDREREAVLRGAEEAGVGPDHPAREVLDGWLRERPGGDLLEAWKGYARALAESLEPAERDSLRRELLDRARGVAEAAGGFLGMGKVSDAEQAVLEELAAAFRP